MSLYIYIIECTRKNEILHKIGVTGDLEKRLKNIKTGNPDPVFYAYTEERDDAYNLEKWLHSQFSNKRLEGEWFKDLSTIEIRKKIFQYNNFDF
jgi:predicted GIY-YIG superfamily endonuclease